MFSVRAARQFSTSTARAVAIKAVPSSSDSVSTLKIVVKNAGSKSASAGLPHLLAASTFLDTAEKSGLRLKREAELLGGEYSAEITRDALVLKATFLKEALPFFVNNLGSAIANAAYKPHELNEVAGPYASHVYATNASSSKFKALEELHAITYRSGLGLPLYYDGSKSYTSEDIALLAKEAFLSENVEIIGENVVESDLQKFVAESPFATLPTGNDVIAQKQPTYTGAETRIRQAGKTTAVIGFPVEDVAAFDLVAAGLIANIASVDAKVLTYEGSNLFYAAVTSDNATEVANAISKVAKTLKTEDFSKYSKLASLLAQRDVAAKSVSVPSEFNFVVVGDVDTVPLKSEL
ncbi:hypothetical protein CANINC_001584 [Pichia inconspicua]|uniref:Cytochrome b-c1 complex subunit 2, mitochondrial n=1 Tax=Pichia inconspicua TaxID=52247 RepID=A0A4T0X3N7_9ASCO|nr:hypothetical protein CANINC_001584 [[Candida] inconspicua]